MNQQSNITLILLTKNEEENIKKNFKWLDEVPRIDEIIAVDDQSTDNTVEALTALGNPKRKIKSSTHLLNCDFAAQRQLAISRSNNDWILWLDPDEIPSSDTLKFLNSIDLSTPGQYSFRRHDEFLGRILNHGENGANRFVRLFNKNSGKFIGKIHEVWQGSGAIADHNLVITHSTAKDLYTFIKKINFYSSIRAQELFDNGNKTNLFEIIFYPIAKFFHNYILRFGFLDSTQGIIMALSMSLYSFLVRAKLWHLGSKTSS